MMLHGIIAAIVVVELSSIVEWATDLHFYMYAIFAGLRIYSVATFVFHFENPL